MKKQLTLILLGVAATFVSVAQQGNLVPDSTSIKKDTLKCTLVYLKGDAIKVDTSSYVIREIAPMVFKGANGTTAKTDKTALLSSRAFTARKEEIEETDIVFIKAKNPKNDKK